MENDPVAVLISDIHFNINNLDLASEALRAAVRRANYEVVPLIIAGDLHDTKAVIRAEVANRLLEILREAKRVIIIAGNHDLVSEKATENAISYLQSETTDIISFPLDYMGFSFIPYQNSSEKFLKAVKEAEHDIIICHQGVLGAYMGDYIQDKTSADISSIKNVKLFSGHYHKHQTIGPLTYLGSPFTHTWGEANDGAKGYIVLNKNGTYTRQILNLRKHCIYNVLSSDLTSLPKNTRNEDLIWVKITGPKSELAGITKKQVSSFLNQEDFKLDLIPDDKTINSPKVENLTNEQILDSIISDTAETDDQKTYLKQLWRDLVR